MRRVLSNQAEAELVRGCEHLTNCANLWMNGRTQRSEVMEFSQRHRTNIISILRLIPAPFKYVCFISLNAIKGGEASPPCFLLICQLFSLAGKNVRRSTDRTQISAHYYFSVERSNPLPSGALRLKTRYDSPTCHFGLFQGQRRFALYTFPVILNRSLFDLCQQTQCGACP